MSKVLKRVDISLHSKISDLLELLMSTADWDFEKLTDEERLIIQNNQNLHEIKQWVNENR